MISIFERVIKGPVAENLTDGDFPLNYLKFSTVTSGSGMSDKVIFLVFKKRTDLPFLCIKTVRNYEAKHAILRNFDNLRKLNLITHGSSHDRLFARAIHLYDDGETVFSIETACQGSRIGKDKQKLLAVIEEYIEFQAHVAKQNGSLQGVEEFMVEALAKSKLREVDQSVVLAYFDNLPRVEIKLPRVIQHGDLTPDNILWSKKGLRIVDYDDVGNTDAPGFDLFCLFRRFSSIDFPKLRAQYFPAYFKKIGGKFPKGSYLRLLFLYHFIEHVQKKSHNYEMVSTQKIVSDFELLYAKNS